MSTVWVARDKQENVEVAIKAISLDTAGWRAEVRDRFTKEARLLALGKHENLVAVRDVGETDDGFLFLVLDLLRGETLADRIARPPPLDWKQAAELSLAISRGVAALHRTGIVHRDLKPANIVLHETASGVVPKIIDLGISKVRAAAVDPELCATLTATGQVLGTPQYMSYEQALGEPDVDARSDVWALGVILFEMIARERPFEAPNANAVLAAIRRTDAPSLADLVPEVPSPIASLVERSLRTRREERFVDAGAFASGLEAAIEASIKGSSPASASPSRRSDARLSPPPRVSRVTPAGVAKSSFSSPNEPARGRWPAIVVVMLLVALGAAATVVLMTPQDGPRSVVSSSSASVATATVVTPPSTPLSASSAPVAETTQNAGKLTATPPASSFVPNTERTPPLAPSGKRRITGVNEAGF